MTPQRKFCVYYKLLSGHQTYIHLFADDEADARQRISTTAEVFDEKGNRIQPEAVTAIHELFPRSRHN